MVTCSPPSGTRLPVGRTTVLCSATDATGNANTRSFTVSIYPAVANLPTISGATNQVLEATSPSGAVATFSVTATNVCQPFVPVICTPPSGSLFPLGTNTVTCVTVDALGVTNTATFNVTILPPAPPVFAACSAGTYNGLFYETNQVAHQTSGFFTLTATRCPAFSASLTLAGRKYSFKGVFDREGKATNLVTRSQLSGLLVKLQLVPTTNGSDQIAGTVSDGVWQAELFGNRSLFNAKTNPCGLAGKYQMIIPGGTNAAVSPSGSGYATVTVDSAGKIKLSGALADGTKITQSATLGKTGQWPLYLALYSAQGSMLSWITFTNAPTTDLNGALSWIKPANVRSKYYPSGFAVIVDAAGARYNAPVGVGSKALNIALGNVVLTDGNLARSITNLVSLGSNNKVTNLSSNKLSLSITLSTGSFSGSVVNPATAKSIRIQGALQQKLNTGYGYFLGTNQSGQVFFGPAP